MDHCSILDDDCIKHPHHNAFVEYADDRLEGACVISNDRYEA
jgi:hypothetical protein